MCNCGKLGKRGACKYITTIFMVRFSIFMVIAGKVFIGRFIINFNKKESFKCISWISIAVKNVEISLL